MIQTLLSVLTADPDALIDHAGGYLELASAESSLALSTLRTRSRLIAGIHGGIVIGVALSLAALMLLGAVPLAQMPAPWLLALAPALPFSAALCLYYQLGRQHPVAAYPQLREQIALDAELMRQAVRHGS